MDKCDDSLRTEKELNKIIASPKNEGDSFQRQPFSPENEYKLNEVENEIESFVNISDIKNESNNEHFFIEDNINNKKETDNDMKIEKKNENNNIGHYKISSNFISMDNENYKLLKKNIQKNKKNNSSTRSTINIFNSISICLQNSNINKISHESVPKFSKNKDYNIGNKNVFNSDRYSKIHKSVFSNYIKTNNDNNKNILLSSLSYKNLNINKLINSNFPSKDKLNFYNKEINSIILDYSNRNIFNDKNNSLKLRLNKLENKLKNNNKIFKLGNSDNMKNNYIDISEVNHLKLGKKLYDSNKKNNIYTLNEISKNFDRIFNIIENNVKNKQNPSCSNIIFKNTNNQSSFSSLNKINYFKRKFLTKKESINDYMSKNNNVYYQKNEYEENKKTMLNDFMKFKNKYLHKMNFISNPNEYERSNLNYL